MNYTCFIHPDAELQLEEMANFLEQQRAGFGLIFLEEYYNTLGYLEKQAHSQPVQRKNFRQVIVGRFKVLLVYVLLEDQVVILNVVHTSRHPSKRYKIRK